MKILFDLQHLQNGCVDTSDSFTSVLKQGDVEPLEVSFVVFADVLVIVVVFCNTVIIDCLRVVLQPSAFCLSRLDSYLFILHIHLHIYSFRK